MLRIMCLLSVLVFTWVVSGVSMASIHDDIESCDVLNDENCLKSLLHRLAGNGSGGSDGTVRYACG